MVPFPSASCPFPSQNSLVFFSRSLSLFPPVITSVVRKDVVQSRCDLSEEAQLCIIFSTCLFYNFGLHPNFLVHQMGIKRNGFIKQEYCLQGVGIAPSYLEDNLLENSTVYQILLHRDQQKIASSF